MGKDINLGAGAKILPWAINVDIRPGTFIDEVVDLRIHPWPWKDESVDNIYASHIIEHFHDQKAFLDECIRILKKGGLLHITGPHASCVPSVGCLGHYRTYSYSTFDDYLSRHWYMYDKPVFKTVHQELRWWYEKSGLNVPSWADGILQLLNGPLSWLINLSPRIYENFFAGIVPCREVVWIGEKI